MDLYGEAFKAEGSMAKYQRAMELVLAKERAGQALFSAGGKGGTCEFFRRLQFYSCDR